jgi:photosystem I subunit 11
MYYNRKTKINFKTKQLNMTVNTSKRFDVVGPYENDPFVGNLSTPITTSLLTKSYIKSLPAYKAQLSPLLRGLNIGFVHGYFLLGPFVNLGPLRASEAANFVGFVSTISLIVILTTCLLIYGYVTFSEKNTKDASSDFLTAKGWNQFTSGFIVGGFGGTSVAYVLLKFLNFEIPTF